MKYKSGKDARLGDKVCLPGEINGIVVFSIDADEYAPDFPREDWQYLKRGIMVQFDKIGLVHYEEPDEDLNLVARA